MNLKLIITLFQCIDHIESTTLHVHKHYLDMDTLYWLTALYAYLPEPILQIYSLHLYRYSRLWTPV